MSSQTDRLNVALAGRYRIERELGTGGMATVYLAQDLKHDRKVAIKVLKPELAAVLGGERFVVEIKTTASLQHPHILPLFDSGTADGFLFYVMPYIEGETIREKLNRETQFGVDEAVRIAREVADALDYAHRHGVIHRDIKPENILLHDGRAMVMDFGIALAVSTAAGGRMTDTGLSLGTPHYMSPEQSTADKEISGRSDIYSLASVLYEMLAGVPPHEGGSAQQVIMRIITDTPRPVTDLRKSVPPNVSAALGRALEKLPADRFETAKAFSDALANSTITAQSREHTEAAAGGSQSAHVVLATTVAIALLAMVTAAWGWLRAPAAPPASSYRITLSGAANAPTGWGNVTLSADGRVVVFVPTGDSTGSQLWVKLPDRADAEPVAGTSRARAPALSSDNTTIAFVADGRLRKIAITGGNAVTIAEQAAERSPAVAWRDDGTILFTGRDGALMSVSENGAVQTVIAVDSLRDPIVSIASVARSRIALIVTCSTNCATNRLWAVELDRKRLIDLAVNATRVWALAGGYVAFTQPGTVRVASFDPGTHAFRTAPISVLEDVAVSGNPNTHVAIAANGLLLYDPAAPVPNVEPVWASRDGRVTLADSGRQFPAGGVVNLSPDGKSLAVEIRDGRERSDVWVEDFSARTFTRLTRDGGSGAIGWTRDGQSVLYQSRPEGSAMNALKRRRVVGGSQEETLFESARDFHSATQLRDSTRSLVRLGAPPTRDIFVARRDRTGGDSALVPLLASAKYQEVSPSLSPDERWIAYSSDELGRFEIYVRPFPDVGSGQWQISQDGGWSPRWAHNGHEIFYRNYSNEMVTVSVATSGSFSVGARRVLFKVPAGTIMTPVDHLFDVAPDDQRFLFLRGPSSTTASSPNTMILVPNWLDDVKARLSGRK